MKSARITFFISLFFFSSGSAAAAQGDPAAAPPQGGSKIGFVNSLEVLYGTAEGQQKIAEVQKFIEEQQAEFDQRQEELQRLRDQVEAQRRTLNLQTLTEMQRAIDEKDRTLRRFQEDIQVEINQRRDEILEAMEAKIQQLIAEYARQGTYSAIFLQGESQIYVAPSLEITADIIRIYNERHPVGSAQPPPPSGSSQP